MMDSPPSANIPPAFWRSKPGIALGMVLVIVLFYLAREHYGHVLGLLPYMILLLCPLMHFFGHHQGGHGHHGEASASIKDANRR
ncbi:DUF2933 domain-containing protein [Pseudomonas corrugata]|uniref:DUF2933 domain-containing protein n=1 Tax=Pseudomonas corrugata TaxID=47879 RepID=A0A3M3EAH4_9PSED|nr:DUF2933 domain-containing protein [Pseudomonas corrugata]MDU9026210.1 DUF2933 domain-containing protein [Pseudomonas corrugata]MDU9033185.1 DUF2933 domain-containing protein [Pseudomonas corrugata]MDU9041199.1 DUF2933 domain-containing protein [Pseudomonas corrugata]QTH15049.1 DUF2933 domain-containing protein [Pseudomonas corrugata]RMM46598.1 hypothetical protein ALQ77_04647 [Pseudomonas corrugata]